MTNVKSQVVYFSDEQEMVDLVTSTLSHQFEVTAVTGLTGLDDAVEALREIRPAYVIVDPHLESLDHQQLHRQIQADEELKGIHFLIVRDGGGDH
jgi:DNA-binding response OmpR family regulator